MNTKSQFPPLSSKLPVLWHGGDYNAEQWPRAVWDEDMELMEKARCNVATVGVFSWAALEPEEGRYEFGWMDDLLDLLHRTGRCAVLATPSASQPTWMSKAYPEVLRVGPNRLRRLHGGRVNFCWTSPVYRAHCKRIAGELAKRYGNHPALLMWHVSNEYSGECYCELCRQAFIEWLQVRYEGDLARLNACYWSRFWGHEFGDWQEIDIPSEHSNTAMQSLSLDWRRFVSDQIVSFMRNESEPLREYSPSIPTTTNLMGFYGGLDPRKVAPHVDVISWDSYPEFVGRPIEWSDWAKVALIHNLNRSLKQKPFLLIESTPSSSNWYPAMSLKPNGRHKMEAFLALGHGSEGSMYFQWRQSRGGQEQFHGAVVMHGFTDDSRVFGEVRGIGLELEKLSGVVGTRNDAEVAIVYDWESGWAQEAACGPTIGDKGYMQTCIDHYRPLWEIGVTTDLVEPEADLSGYKLVLVPMLYLFRPGLAERLREYVRAGGTLVATYMTGWVNESSLVFESGFFGELSDVFGIRVEEMDAIYPSESMRVVMTDGAVYMAKSYCERIHVRGAEVLATYGDRFYAGEAAVTRNSFGEGTAVYVASRNDHAFTRRLVEDCLKSAGVRPVVDWQLPEGVVVEKRVGADCEYLFVTNCKNEAASLTVEDGLVDAVDGAAVETRLELKGFGARVFRRSLS